MKMKKERCVVTGVEIIEVIRVSLTLGDGKDMSTLLRPGFQYWSKEGELLANVDEHQPQEQSGMAIPIDEALK